MIQLEKIKHVFPIDHTVLADVTASFQEGSLTFLTGVSGVGKTTLLNLLLGLIKPTEGEIRVNEVDITKLRYQDLALYRQQVGVIRQGLSLLPKRTIFENLAIPLWIRGLSNTETRERVRASLVDVDLAHSDHRLPHVLSTGEQCRAAIARAVIAQPKLLLADEPTGNLDASHAEQMIDLFRHYQSIGTTTVVSTHNQSLFQSGDRVLLLQDGSPVELTKA